MNKVRTTIYLSHSVKQMLADSNLKASTRLSQVCDRYALIMREHGIDLDDHERDALRDAVKGRKLSALEIADLVNVVPDLRAKIEAHTLADLIAEIERIETNQE